MRLIIDIPDEMDAAVLEAFGAPDMNGPIHSTPNIPATKEQVEERLKNYLRQQLYAYQDNMKVVQTMRARAEEQW